MEDTDEDEGGTSFSCALIAGIAALMLENNPGMTREDVLNELRTLTKGFEFARQEDEEEKRIKGVDINEVVSMQQVQRQNRTEFTGCSPKKDFYQAPEV